MNFDFDIDFNALFANVCECFSQLSYGWFLTTLIGILVVAFLVQEFYYFYFYRSYIRYSNKINRSTIHFSYRKPPVSVIICARNEAENLQKNLESILQQDYPNFEVIVVNDGSTDYTEDVLTIYKDKYPHFYHTFLPEEAKYISRKKMALTVGIKAAKNDILLFTDADCRVESKDWISEMVKNFDNETEVVLGYGAYLKKNTMLSRLISYDTFTILLQYWGFALKGIPYMGVGRNLAYRKSTFMANKGFVSLMNVQSGDDDLFVAQVANGKNTKIEVAPKSITYSEPKVIFRDWFIQKSRHLSTSPYYKSGVKSLIGTEVFSRFLFYLSVLLLLIFGDVFLRCVVLAIFLFRFLTQLIIINKSAKRLNERKFHFDIILFDIFLPLTSFYIMVFSRRAQQSNYKWK